MIAAACGRPAAPSRVTKNGDVIASNILRRDYAGSQACADCHHEIYDKWAASPMRNMTRDAASARIKAPFSGEKLTVGTDTATMTRTDNTRFVEIVGTGGTQKFKITKVVGGRYREDFVGVEVSGGDGLEHVLPMTWVFVRM